MFSKLFAAAALAVVSAADVPVFSSNDDYDEINLNIRMLSGNTTTKATTGDQVISHSFSFTGSFADGETYDSLNSNQAFKNGCENGLKGAISDAKSVEVTGVSDGTSSRRARQLAVTLTPAIAYDVTVSAANVDAVKALVTSGGSSGTFATSLATSLTVALATAGYSVTISSITPATTATTAPAPAAPAAAAAPSPSPSSNAAKVAVSTVAAFAAFMASMM